MSEIIKNKLAHLEKELILLSASRKEVIAKLTLVEDAIVAAKVSKENLEEDLRVWYETTPQPNVEYETLLDVP